MPKWLFNQLMRAYQSKDRRQIRLLNDCWYFYRTRHVEAGEDGDDPEHHTRPYS